MNDDRNNDVVDDSERRGFVKFLAAAISLVLGAVPLGAGIAFFLDPLAIKKSSSTQSGIDADGVQKDDEGFINLKVTVASLPADGTPLAVKVFDDKVDAWNKLKNVPIGTVWLRRQGEKVIAFNTICPHLGCAVDYRPSNHDFYCPCHTSTFALNGEKQNQIPPRDMDELETKLKPDTDDSIWLKYQDFRAATPEKIEV